MTDITLVAFDLDGTLLDSSNRIRRDSADALRRLQEQGVFVTLITGRAYASTEPYAREINLFTPFGLVHGAHVRDLQGLDLVKRIIPEVGVREALDLAFDLDLVPLLVDSGTQGGLVVCEEHREHPIVRFVLSPKGNDAELQGAETTFIAAIEISIRAYAIYLIGENDKIESFLGTAAGQPVKLFHAERFPIHSQRSQPDLLVSHGVAMLSPMGADKGTALEAVAETLGVPMNNTLAVGDWHNDLPMLAKAGYAAVMGNAPPEILNRIGHPNVYRTGTNDGTGIVDALARFGLF
jgi:hypothetical protein